MKRNRSNREGANRKLTYKAITVIALHSMTVCEEGENLYIPSFSEIASDLALSVNVNSPRSTSNPPFRYSGNPIISRTIARGEGHTSHDIRTPNLPPQYLLHRFKERISEPLTKFMECDTIISPTDQGRLTCSLLLIRVKSRKAKHHLEISRLIESWKLAIRDRDRPSQSTISCLIPHHCLLALGSLVSAIT